MRSNPFFLRLLAASLVLSGVAFAKPVIQVSGAGDGFVISDYEYKVAPDGGSEVYLSLSESDAARLADITKNSLDERITVTIGGTEVLMPRVRGVVPGKELMLSFNDPSTFAAVKAALAK